MMYARCVVAGLLIALIAGCGESQPRSRDEIWQERESLPRLFLTQKTGKEVIAPGNRGAFVDEATGEMCWPALACHAENCPGRSADGKPYVFSSYGGESSKAVRPGEFRLAGCPMCLEAGRPPDPSAIRPYVLPEIEARLRQLDEEYRRRVALEQQRL
jgi:hypothetical protein